MAPNLSSVRAPSEALDSFLARHDTHESLEVIRNEKLEAYVSNLSVEETTKSSMDHSFVEESAFDFVTENPEHSGILIDNHSKVSKLDYSKKSSETQPTGKSLFPIQDSVSNLPSNDKITDPKILNHSERDFNFNDPEESLLNHDPSIQEALKHQQEDLLEMALKETISVAKEEEQWAVVEKRLAEDLSFARAVEELLQQTAEDDGPVRMTEIVEVAPIVDQLDNFDSNIENEPQNIITERLVSDRIEPTIPDVKPILTKRTTVSPHSHIDEGVHYIISSRVSHIPPFVPSTTNTPTEKATTETTPRLSTSNVKRKNKRYTTHKPTERAVDLYIEPTGILRIPGHEPETPADIELFHHEHSKEFLEDQGARVLNDAMSAEGATAVILSSMCLLFIAFIGIAYFFTKQRKNKFMAKVAADIENQREKHLTTDGGRIVYNLQPAPTMSLKSTPIFKRNQNKFQTYNPNLNTDLMSTKPKSKPSTLYPSTLITNENMTSEKAALAARISEKAKMAEASCSDKPKMAVRSPSKSCPLPNYKETQGYSTELSFSPTITPNGTIPRTPASRGKLFFSLSYDPLREALLLHVQQARFSQVRSAGRVCVEACILTAKNGLHTKARTDVTTATQGPVFNSRIAFQIAMGHLDELLLRLTLVCCDYEQPEGSDLNTLGSIILPLVTCDLTQKITLIRDFN